jgi:hypothetical protein
MKRGSSLSEDWLADWEAWLVNELRWHPPKSRATSFTPKRRQPVATEDPKFSDDKWRELLIRFRNSLEWSPTYGPVPHQPGSFAPVELIEELGVMPR